MTKVVRVPYQAASQELIARLFAARAPQRRGCITTAITRLKEDLRGRKDDEGPRATYPTLTLVKNVSAELPGHAPSVWQYRRDPQCLTAPATVVDTGAQPSLIFSHYQLVPAGANLNQR
jgi:hypothetical protein